MVNLHFGFHVWLLVFLLLWGILTFVGMGWMDKFFRAPVSNDTSNPLNSMPKIDPADLLSYTLPIACMAALLVVILAYNLMPH